MFADITDASSAQGTGFDLVSDGVSSAVESVECKSERSKASLMSWCGWVALLPLLDSQTCPGEGLALAVPSKVLAEFLL